MEGVFSLRLAIYRCVSPNPLSGPRGLLHIPTGRNEHTSLGIPSASSRTRA